MTKPTTDTPRINPYIGIAIGVFAVSTSSIFIKSSDAPALVLSTYRMLFTFLLILPATLLRYGGELRSLTRKDLYYALASGAFLALHFATWISSLKFTSVSSSTVLVDTQPIFVVIGSYFFLKEKVSKGAFWGVLTAFAGSLIISFTDFQVGGTAFLGDLLALAGAVFVAFYLLLGRSLRKRLSLLPYLFIVYGSCTATLLLLDLVTQTPLWPYPPKDFAIFLALAVFCTIFGHSVFNWVLRYVPAAVVSVATLGEPVGATLLAAAFLGETPGMAQILGGMVVLAGVYIFIMKTER